MTEPHPFEEALERIKASLQEGRLREAVETLLELDPVDQADTLEDLPLEVQQRLFASLDTETRAEILGEVSDDTAVELVSKLSIKRLAELLDETSADVAADILSHMDEIQASHALDQMEEAEEVRTLLQYPEESAGGLMTTVDFILKESQTAEEVIQSIREAEVDANSPYYLYVTDNLGRLLGVVGLRSLIMAKPDTKVAQILYPDVRTINAFADQEQVAQLMKRYRLSLLPVVDDDERLVGVIYADDIAFILEEEATEDMYGLANISGGDIQVWSPFSISLPKRLPWLVINLFTAFLAAAVVHHFESTIQKAAVLAVFLGIVAGQGGNAATQTIAIVVRSIALNQVQTRDVWAVLWREFLIGLTNGIVIGGAVGIGAYYWHGNGILGLIVGIAMLGNMIAAAIAGTLVPLSLKALRLDPALASSVLVTTVTDSVGFGLTLGLASWAISSFGLGV